MPNIQQIIGGTAILAGLIYFCCHDDQWQQLSHGSNVRSGPNNIRVDQQNMDEGGTLWTSFNTQQQRNNDARRRLNTTNDCEVEHFLHHDVFENRERARPQPRIVGGIPSTAGSFPYYAKSIGNTLCGATLIWEDVLLSAANCEGAFVDGVAIGGTKLDNSDATVLEVDSEYIHPAYDPVTKANGTLFS
jgi:hypothetical protein